MTREDPRGFALGLAHHDLEGMGRFWFHEGETLGCRAVFAYSPTDDLVATVFLNSRPSDDHIAAPMAKLYAIFTR